MIRLTVTINSGNDDIENTEDFARLLKDTAKLLKDTAKRIKDSGLSVTKVLDSNGNSVGTVEFAEVYENADGKTTVSTIYPQ